MQFNAAASSDVVKQFLCYCVGVPRYLNIHKNQKGKADLNG
jgi:hypothetical protein